MPKTSAEAAHATTIKRSTTYTANVLLLLCIWRAIACAVSLMRPIAPATAPVEQGGNPTAWRAGRRTSKPRQGAAPSDRLRPYPDRSGDAEPDRTRSTQAPGSSRAPTFGGVAQPHVQPVRGHARHHGGKRLAHERLQVLDDLISWDSRAAFSATRSISEECSAIQGSAATS